MGAGRFGPQQCPLCGEPDDSPLHAFWTCKGIETLEDTEDGLLRRSANDSISLARQRAHLAWAAAPPQPHQHWRSDLAIILALRITHVDDLTQAANFHLGS